MRIRQRLLGYLARKSQEKKEGDKGFTLIELAIVIAVIAILIAVALPTFLGVQSSAHHSAAEQNIVNSITSAKTYYASNQSSYGNATTNTLNAAAMLVLEPSISYINTATANVANQVAVNYPTTDGQSIGFAAFTGGSSSDCIYAINLATNADATGGLGAGTWWATGPAATGVCDAPSTLTAISSTNGWSPNTP